MLAWLTIIVAAIQDLFSQTQNHVFLKFKKIKAFQTPHRGV